MNIGSFIVHKEILKRYKLVKAYVRACIHAYEHTYIYTCIDISHKTECWIEMEFHKHT